MANGIAAWGAYVPFHRIQRSAIAEALGMSSSDGTRSVAGFDEDTTTLAVEAGRSVLRNTPTTVPDTLLFATSSPAYADKMNATTVHAALGLPEHVGAFDLCGGPRSGIGALILALRQRGRSLVAMSDVRVGLPGSTDERMHGDAGAAFLCTDDDDVAAEVVGMGSASAEFLDRWRLPSELTSRIWEERFAVGPYQELGDLAWENALKTAGLDESAVTRVAIAGGHPRAVGAALTRRAFSGRKVSHDLGVSVGYTGAAHAGLLLAAMLDEADPGEIVGLQSLSDGSDVLLFRVNAAAVTRRPVFGVADQVLAGTNDLLYTQFLSWRQLMPVEPPRRPEPARPAAPPSWRSRHWKFAFSGSRCRRCHHLSLPPQRVCYSCHAVDDMEPEPLSSATGRVANFTIDRLAYTPSPPMVAGLVDLDGGGRFQGEFTDVDLEGLEIGAPMELTFRRLFTAGSVHDYFWKARPMRRNS